MDYGGCAGVCEESLAVGGCVDRLVGVTTSLSSVGEQCKSQLPKV